jgi:hypothetical protein
MPEGHTFATSWSFTFIFEGQVSVEFSSSCTAVNGWDEIGSLNMKLVHSSDHLQGKEECDGWNVISPASSICGIEKITVEDRDVIAECGLAFVSPDGFEIIVTSGVPPGSVSISAPFSQDTFAPEFPLSACKRTSVGISKCA